MGGHSGPLGYHHNGMPQPRAWQQRLGLQKDLCGGQAAGTSRNSPVAPGMWCLWMGARGLSRMRQEGPRSRDSKGKQAEIGRGGAPYSSASILTFNLGPCRHQILRQPAKNLNAQCSQR